MNAEDRVTLIVGEDEHGQKAIIEFPDTSIVVDPKAVAYVDGTLTVQIPSTIDVPLGACVVEQWFPPEQEQVWLAVQALSPTAVARLLIEEQMTDMAQSMGVLAIRAVARAIMGETGAD